MAKPQSTSAEPIIKPEPYDSSAEIKSILIAIVVMLGLAFVIFALASLS